MMASKLFDEVSVTHNSNSDYSVLFILDDEYKDDHAVYMLSSPNPIHDIDLTTKIDNDINMFKNGPGHLWPLKELFDDYYGRQKQAVITISNNNYCFRINEDTFHKFMKCSDVAQTHSVYVVKLKA